MRHAASPARSARPRIASSTAFRLIERSIIRKHCGWPPVRQAHLLGAPDHLDDPLTGPRPRVPAAQAPRPGPGVPAVLRRRDGAVPRGERRADHRRADPRRRPRATGSVEAAERSRLQPRALRQRPVVRRVLAVGGRARRRLHDRPQWSLQGSSGACRHRDPARARAPGPALPRRCRRRPPAVRATGLDRRGRAAASRRAVPGVGRLPLRPAPAGRHGPPRRRAQPALRPAAGARRVQALLAGR